MAVAIAQMEPNAAALRRAAACARDADAAHAGAGWAQLWVRLVSAHGTLVRAALGTIASAAIEYLPSQIIVNRLCASLMNASVASL